jgi:hypothetical protein
VRLERLLAPSRAFVHGLRSMILHLAPRRVAAGNRLEAIERRL